VDLQRGQVLQSDRVSYRKYGVARPLRLEFPGAVYHLTSRGNARQKIFLTDQDRKHFLSTLSDVIVRYGWICHAYCLMENHYHLLVETPKGNLSIGMRQLNGIYTQAFNRRHQRVGHLFQGRYKAILVEKQSHLLELCRYVVLNPLRVKGNVNLDAWKWSSYHATAGKVPVPRFLTVDWILCQFGKSRSVALAGYRAFVREGLESRPWEKLTGQIYLGSESFIEEHAPENKKQAEIPLAQLQAARPALRHIFSRHDKNAVEKAYRKYGYKMREIAEHLKVHYATVSRRLRKLELEARAV
jgi:putative transposase